MSLSYVLFAASSLSKHSGSTPWACLAAIKAWHIAHNMEWKGSAHLHYVLNGVHNLAPGHASSAKIFQPALAVFELLWEHLAGCKNLKKC